MKHLAIAIMTLFFIGSATPGCSGPIPPEKAKKLAPPETVVTPGNVPIAPGWEPKTLVRGLEHPWSMVWLPDGTMLVTERPGRLRLVRDGQLASDPIPGTPEVFAQGQGGLLDISLHPEFTDNRLVYFTYSTGDDDANRTNVGRGRYADGRIKDFERIFQVEADKNGTQHFGSRMLWLPDNTLLVSIGDGGNPPISLGGEYIRNKAQRLDFHLGKILRLNPDGSVPEGNPFVADDNALDVIYSYGHRNVQGLAWDPARKTVWASEHGALGGDELNRIEPGRNYGWPLATYSREYTTGRPIAEQVTLPGKVDPRLLWPTAIAPSGMACYTGDVYPEWKNDLFVCGLVTQDVRRIDLDSAGNILGQSALRIGTRVRHVSQGPDGHLYVLTDEDSGRLIRIEPSEEGRMAP